MTAAPCCTACGVNGLDTVGTHVDPDEPNAVWCSDHALPGGVPLAGAVAQSRQNVWPGHDEPQGMEGEHHE